MKRARKIFSVLTLLFAVVAMTTFVSAQEKSDSDAPTREMKRDGQFGKRYSEGKRGKRGMRGHRGDKGLTRMLRGLELTEDQKVQVKTLSLALNQLRF